MKQEIHNLKIYDEIIVIFVHKITFLISTRWESYKPTTLYILYNVLYTYPIKIINNNVGQLHSKSNYSRCVKYLINHTLELLVLIIFIQTSYIVFFFVEHMVYAYNN